MNSVILCEGFDDAYILGYYLYKMSDSPKWERDVPEPFSQSFDLPKIKARNQQIDVYSRNQDKLAIWCVGGNEHMLPAVKHLQKLCTLYPQERFKRIVTVLDRDQSEISFCLKSLEDSFNVVGWKVSLQNNKITEFAYTVEDEQYDIGVVPLVIPFEETGALETLLMGAVAAQGSEECFVVESAKKYIHDLIKSGKLSSYLKHDRQKLKAQFSAVVSVTNPDRSTALFNTLLMSFPWETSEQIRKHFALLEHIFIE